MWYIILYIIWYIIYIMYLKCGRTVFLRKQLKQILKVALAEFCSTYIGGPKIDAFYLWSKSQKCVNLWYVNLWHWIFRNFFGRSHNILTRMFSATLSATKISTKKHENGSTKTAYCSLLKSQICIWLSWFKTLEKRFRRFEKFQVVASNFFLDW